MMQASIATCVTREKVLEENRRVHALENRLYLSRHPEQTNFFQKALLKKTVNYICGNLEPDSRILDLGCGTGYFSSEFLALGYNLTGLDLSQEMIQVFADSIPESQKQQTSLFVGDVETFLSQNEEQFDVVILSAILHHLFDYELVLRQICSRLASGQKLLIFFEPLKQEVHSLLRYFLHRTLSWIDEGLYRFDMKTKNISVLDDEYQHSDYQRQFGGLDLNLIYKILVDEGLKIDYVEKYCARRYGLNAWLANRLLGTENTFNLLAIKP